MRGPDVTERTCSSPGCENPLMAMDLCLAHWADWARENCVDVSEERRTCERDGCKKPHYAKGLCRLHWQRDYYRSKRSGGVQGLSLIHI